MDLLVEMIKRHEGVRLKPYLDTVGKMTIGVGRNLDDNGITESEAEILLLNDITRVRNEVWDAFSWYAVLNTTRKDVIVDMVFNLGLTRFQGFKMMVDFMAVGNYSLAADQMTSSKWSVQVGARAVELAEMMRTGRYPKQV